MGRACGRSKLLGQLAYTQGMRILTVHPGPPFSVHDVWAGWDKALRKQGHQVASYRTDDRLSFYGKVTMPDLRTPACPSCGEVHHYKAFDRANAEVLTYNGLFEQVYLQWPDVIFFVSGFFTNPEMFKVLRLRGHKIVILHTESPYQDVEQMERGQYADLNLVNDPANLEAWASVGPTCYVPHSYDPDLHYPSDAEPSFDLGFVGTAFKSRQSLFADMLRDTNYKIGLGGGGWNNLEHGCELLAPHLAFPAEACVDNKDTAQLYRDSRAGINFYRREFDAGNTAKGESVGPREVEMAACGLPFLRDPRPESDELFPFLPAYDGSEEAREQLHWLLTDEDRRKELGIRARLAVEGWTFDDRAYDVMNLIGGLV